MGDVPLRIMIVEDEALLLMQLESTIAEEGHDVVGTAMTSGEASALARLVEPDIAFIDLNLLDGPTGIHVARHLRASEKTLVVFITANATRIPEDYEGAAGIISKPFSQSGMTACIRFLAECVRQPPPKRPIPTEFRIAPAYHELVNAAV